MSFLSNLPKIVTKRKKRLGRGAGSGKGAKSTRGTTRHQKARESIPMHFEGGQAKLVKKYPLLRGKGKNKSVREKAFAVRLVSLNKFENGAVVDVKTLISKGIIDDAVAKVKIVNGGVLKKKLTVKVPVSRSVQEAVEKKGGTVSFS